MAEFDVTCVGSGFCLQGEDGLVRDVVAWNDLRRPGLSFFYLQGEIEVPNIGVEPLLTTATNQSIDRDLLTLDLHLRQTPGQWAVAPVWRRLEFSKVIHSAQHEVLIEMDGRMLARIPVRDLEAPRHSLVV